MTDIETLKNMIDESENVVFFGGAGVSTESGIPDFRGKDGLYKKKYDVDPEYLLSVECFEDHPDWFWDFYRNKILIDGVKPNDAHYALVKLEESGKLKAIVTQNIDNLHELAGSKKVYHIHGTINTCHCPYCGKTFTLDEIKKMPLVPRCDCGLTDNYIENKLKEYKQSSLAVGLKALAEGRGDAFVSAGSTGAIVVGATLIVKRIKGIKRAALASVIPGLDRSYMLLDLGANVECRPEMLCQFASMGSIYMNKLEGVENPEVGLINIGAEER